MNQQRSSQRGITAIEVGLLVALVAIAIIAAMRALALSESAADTASPPAETTTSETTTADTTPGKVIDTELELLGDDEPSPDATVIPASAPGESVAEPEPVVPHADPILPATPLEEPAANVEAAGAKPALRD
ncbi:MAG: Flp family type IVb pilin [Patescibacteria group bacterium]